MHTVAWFLVGIAIGGLVGLAARRESRIHALLPAAVGLLGAAIGGLLLRPLSDADPELARISELPGWLLSLGGAMIALATLDLMRRRTR